MAKKAKKSAKKAPKKDPRKETEKDRIQKEGRPHRASTVVEGRSKQLKTLIKENTPTRLIAMKLKRSEISVRGKVQRAGLSLRPTNRSPRD